VAIAKAALAAGRTPGTGLVIVRGGTTVEQQTLITTLGDAAADIKAAKLAGNGDVFLGDGVASAAALGWFESRPLFGWRVLVPRTKDQAGELSASCACTARCPSRCRRSASSRRARPQQMERADRGHRGRALPVDRASQSVNAVRAIRERFEQRGLDARHWRG
jgi:uroporphyrinogen III methyltransferase/synthase